MLHYLTGGLSVVKARVRLPVGLDLVADLVLVLSTGVSPRAISSLVLSPVFNISPAILSADFLCGGIDGFVNVSSCLLPKIYYQCIVVDYLRLKHISHKTELLQSRLKLQTVYKP